MPISSNRRRTRPTAQTGKQRLPQRPSVSPRYYAAKIDLLRVQDCLAAGMKQCEIARHLRKDPAWVSRAVGKLLRDKEMAYATDAEQAAREELNQDFDRLVGVAMAAIEGEDQAVKKLSAIRVAAEVLQRKIRFQFATGQIRRPDASSEGPSILLKSPLHDYGPEVVDEYLVKEAERIRAERGGSF